MIECWGTTNLLNQLNGGTLDSAILTVTSDVVHHDEDEDEPLKEGHPIEQSDKPRAGSK